MPLQSLSRQFPGTNSVCYRSENLMHLRPNLPWSYNYEAWACLMNRVTKQSILMDEALTKRTYACVCLQYIPRNMHTVFVVLCFVVVIHWLIFPYPPGLLHWHCGNLTIAPVPAKQPWWIWIHTSCEFIMNDNITTTKQSTTKPCAYFLGYTVYILIIMGRN